MQRFKSIFQEIQTNSKASKINQISDTIIQVIKKQRLPAGTRLPSINEWKTMTGYARDTVIQSFDKLKREGIIESKHGMGYFTKTATITRKRNVFVLFDVIGTAYKEELHRGIIEGMANKVQPDFYFHHFNVKQFLALLNNAKGNFDYYVVMPFPDEKIKKALSEMDQQKLLLLDINSDFTNKDCSYLCQNFDSNMIKALLPALEQISSYKKFNLIFPENKNQPVEIKSAFTRFCTQHKIPYSIQSKLNSAAINKGELWFVMEDHDLVNLVKILFSKQWKIGSECGIISYNDFHYKEVVAGGITTLSIDFFKLGKKAGELMAGKDHVENIEETHLILRNSLTIRSDIDN